MTETASSLYGGVWVNTIIWNCSDSSLILRFLLRVVSFSDDFLSHLILSDSL